MKERPILFSAAMIRAILAGQKTQTRRIVKPQPDSRTTRVSVCRDQWMGNGPSGNGVGTAQWDPWRKSPFAAGDWLWVRETWLPDPDADSDAWHTHDCTYYEWSGCGSRIDSVPAQLQKPDHCIYRADWDGHDLVWRPSIHMPRWASRILLEIVSVRVERLQDISEADALAEGVKHCEAELDTGGNWYAPEELYSMLWTKINGWGDSGWNTNPWVWVVEFRRVEE